MDCQKQISVFYFACLGSLEKIKKADPITPAMIEAVNMPNLENISKSGSLCNAKLLINKAIVNPIPARKPTASIWPQVTPFGSFASFSFIAR